MRTGSYMMATVSVVILLPQIARAYPAPLSFFKFDAAEGPQQNMVSNYGYYGTQDSGHWLQMFTNSQGGTFDNVYTVPCNCLSGEGEGVSSLGTDRALKLPVTNMGTDGQGLWARAQVLEGAASYDHLTGMTVTVWFKAFSVLKKNPALVWNLGAGTFAWTIEGNTGTSPADGVPLKFQSGGMTTWASGDGTSAGTSLYKETNEWVFLAMTYNGETHEVKWYKGGTGTHTTELVRADTAVGGVGGGGVGLSIGGRTTLDRPFYGLIDNVRVFGSRTDPALPVLTQEELEGLRLMDAVPEPGLVLGAGVLALTLVRWRG